MKITGKEFEAYSVNHQVLSDMDYGMDPVTKEFTVPKLEWDSYMGSHWTSYNSEDEREAALAMYDIDLNFWVQKHRIEVQYEKDMKLKKQLEIKEMKTLGGQFPQLLTLKNSL